VVDGIDTTSVTAEIAERPWYVKLWHWILSWFIEEYEVTVYFVSEIITHPETGESSMKRVKRVFLMKDISKKSQTEIRGKDRNGFPIEIKTVEPFDYTIVKTK
jgi:hypothetical protein